MSETEQPQTKEALLASLLSIAREKSSKTSDESSRIGERKPIQVGSKQKIKTDAKNRLVLIPQKWTWGTEVCQWGAKDLISSILAGSLIYPYSSEKCGRFLIEGLTTGKEKGHFEFQKHSVQAFFPKTVELFEKSGKLLGLNKEDLRTLCKQFGNFDTKYPEVSSLVYDLRESIKGK